MKQIESIIDPDKLIDVLVIARFEKRSLIVFHRTRNDYSILSRFKISRTERTDSLKFYKVTEEEMIHAILPRMI